MESPLKPEYDDVMLQGTFEDAYFTKRYGMIERLDGFSYQNYDIGKEANDLAKRKDGDGVVANGIANAILASMIIYGEIGENFLKTKLEQAGENFSREEYSKDIAKSIVADYQYDRKQGIIDGVGAFLRDDTNCIEANAAKMAIMKNEYWNQSRYDEADILDTRFMEGNVVSSRKVLNRLEIMHHKQVPNDIAFRNLSIAYTHLSKKYDGLSQTFKDNFKGKSKHKILAYYIANLQDDEMERVLASAKKEQTNEEREQ